jgi:YjbE family integral membrane protein
MVENFNLASEIAALGTLAGLTALAKVIMIDLVLAGDNAVVVGMAAAGLPREQRARVIMLGIVGATVLRIFFALFTVQLLQYGKYGLVLAGGLLLVWVSWKLWRELEGQRIAAKLGLAEDEQHHKKPPPKSFKDAVIQVIVADVSMSLDNVLAVAGAARDHFLVLVIGLIISLAFMGLAASAIARLLQTQRWIAYVGLLLIVYVAGDMIWHGLKEVAWVADEVTWFKG